MSRQSNDGFIRVLELRQRESNNQDWMEGRGIGEALKDVLKTEPVLTIDLSRLFFMFYLFFLYVLCS